MPNNWSVATRRRKRRSVPPMAWGVLVLLAVADAGYTLYRWFWA